ncbi:hypothetical protein D3C87_1698810 [compost metagenome]
MPSGWSARTRSNSASVCAVRPWLCLPVTLWCDRMAGTSAARPIRKASSMASQTWSASSRRWVVYRPRQADKGSATPITSSVLACMAVG